MSELSHRSGTAEGKARSLEDEAARLRSSNQQLALERHDKQVAASECKSRLTVLDEKVGRWLRGEGEGVGVSVCLCMRIWVCGCGCGCVYAWLC